MGQRSPQKDTSNSFRVAFHVAWLICGLLLLVPLLSAQPDGAAVASANGSQQQGSTDPTIAPSGQPQDLQAIGSISGMVLDATGAPVSGAQVRLRRASATLAVRTLTQDGHFSFADVAPGPFELKHRSFGF
jgi:hypothetical protein